MVDGIGALVAALGEARWALSVDLPADAESARAIARAGLPGIVPLWVDAPQGFGAPWHATALLVRPWLPMERWPGVFVLRGQALTVSADGATLLPQLLANRVLSNMPSSAAQLAMEWTDVERRARALHAALGGDEATLQAAVDVAMDPAARARLAYRPGDQTDYQRAHSELFRRIDPSAPARAYADWLDAAIAGDMRPVGDPETFGPWGRRLMGVAARGAHTAALGLHGPALTRFLLSDNGLDGVPQQPMWDIQAGGSSGSAQYAHAADLAADETSVDGSVRAGVVRALRHGGRGYAGLAHAEAAVVLDESDEPERAWEALQSAAWWAARAKGEVPTGIFDGIRFLAERRGWTDALGKLGWA